MTGASLRLFAFESAFSLNWGRRMSKIPATYTFVVARSRDCVIGRGNELPWKLPSDLKYFKAITMGRPIVMGRRTYDSIGRPLPGRPNIVISRDGGVNRPGLWFVTSKDEAMDLAQREARSLAASEIMIVGGGEIFKLFDREVCKVHLTEVQTNIPDGDAHYRRCFHDHEWVATEKRHVPAQQDGDEFSYVVTTYERRKELNLACMSVRTREQVFA